MEVKQSVCNYCSTGCNLDFNIEDGKIVKIIGTKNYPVNSGTACIKGLNLDKQCTIYGMQRLPLLRGEDGKMHEISWDEAFKVFAERMTNINEKYGDGSSAFISTGQLPMEEMALIGLIGRGFMKMEGDGNTRLCMATSVVAYKQSFGFDAPGYTLKDLELSDTMIFIGANPAIAHPVLWGRIRKNKDAKKIVIDPRNSETAKGCDSWYGIKPKADLMFLYTLANLLIEKGYINEEYIEKHTEDFEGFKEFVKKYTLEDAFEKTGITKEEICEIAETIHNGKRVSFWWTMGVNQGYEAVRTAQAIINIAVMTGNIGREGTGPNSITGQCNAMGSRLYSNTTGIYAGRDYANEEDRKFITKVMGIKDEYIPKRPTIAYPEIIQGALDGKIKGLWIVSTNPANSWIDNKKFNDAAKNVDFLVVQDLYSDTDTAKICDLFLPAIPGIKKSGTYINTERRLSALVPMVPKEENELTDFEILRGIGIALGKEKELEMWKTPREVFELLKKSSEGMPCDITGVEYEMLRNGRGVQWPFRKGDKLIEDERRLYEDGKFFRPNGKMKFMYEDIKDNKEKQTEEYPYILNTGRGTVGQWHTQTRTREIPIVNKITPADPYIEISEEIAKDKNIEDGELIEVLSSNGKKVKVKAKINSGLKKNQAYGPMHYIEINTLTKGDFDAYSREPSYKFVTININKL
ncbi:molybdopterin oxidoreductase family protein [Eubacterium multiforme]|uniref:Assimilatory nitrate reductase catalytic subunit n=1 Tax=Eubacterium multiforme TaxID=83339 RepID=A0ABT9UPL2_9FIRM|nr:molybdopterin oxidoreductase family protein [Eubacterium multiforme]MDQ0148578.1 assimilatory nitrate reductase catalytic subunit [Eubacterium multiforme]